LLSCLLFLKVPSLAPQQLALQFLVTQQATHQALIQCRVIPKDLVPQPEFRLALDSFEEILLAASPEALI